MAQKRIPFIPPVLVNPPPPTFPFEIKLLTLVCSVVSALISESGILGRWNAKQQKKNFRDWKKIWLKSMEAALLPVENAMCKNAENCLHVTGFSLQIHRPYHGMIRPCFCFSGHHCPNPSSNVVLWPKEILAKGFHVLRLQLIRLRLQHLIPVDLPAKHLAGRLLVSVKAKLCE